MATKSSLSAMRDELVRLYTKEGLTLAAIGQMYGASGNTIGSHLRAVGVTKKDRAWKRESLPEKERIARQKNHKRRWAEKNKQKAKQSKKAYSDKNREKLNAKSREKYARTIGAANAEKQRKKREWEKANPELVSMQRVRRRLNKEAKARNLGLLRNYRVSLDQYDSILEMQGGVCFICQRFEVSKKAPRLVVDHDHESGLPRALLCHRCNCGLGYFKDNEARVIRAAKYLEMFRVSNSNDQESWSDRVRRCLEYISAQGVEAGRFEGVDGVNDPRKDRCGDGASQSHTALESVGD